MCYESGNQWGNYEIEVKKGAHTMKALNGPFYLRILVYHITIDSRSTIYYISKNLSELEYYMMSMNRNVTAVNEFVRLQTDELKERWEASSNIMVNLLKGLTWLMT